MPQLTGMSITKKKKNYNECQKGIREKGTLFTVGGNVN